MADRAKVGTNLKIEEGRRQTAAVLFRFRYGTTTGNRCPGSAGFSEPTEL